MEENIGPVYTALAKAQAEFSPIEKNCVNPYFKKKYADLSEIRRATTPALSKYGLAVIQIIEPDNNFIIVKTVIGHESGSISSTIKLAPTKQDAQGFGSACTYARRYSLAAILNVAADDDDDAQEAVKPVAVQAKAPTAKEQFAQIKKSVAPENLKKFNDVVDEYLIQRNTTIDDMTESEILLLVKFIKEKRGSK